MSSQIVSYEEFNREVHAALARLIDKNPDAANMTVFALMDVGENQACISACNGEYTPHSFLNILVSVFRTCVRRMAEKAKDGISNEEDVVRSYQALLRECVTHGLALEEDRL